MPNSTRTDRTPPIPGRHEIGPDGRPAADSPFLEPEAGTDPHLSEWVGIGGVNLVDRDVGGDPRF